MKILVAVITALSGLGAVCVGGVGALADAGAGTIGKNTGVQIGLAVMGAVFLWRATRWFTKLEGKLDNAMADIEELAEELKEVNAKLKSRRRGDGPNGA